MNHTPELDKNYHCECGKLTGLHNGPTLCKKCYTKVTNRQPKKKGTK